MTFRDWLSVLYAYLFKVDPKSRDLPRPPRRKPPEGLLGVIPGPPGKRTSDSFFPPGLTGGIARKYYTAFCVPTEEPPLTMVGGEVNEDWLRWYVVQNNEDSELKVYRAHKEALKEQEATIEEYLMGEDHGLDH